MKYYTTQIRTRIKLVFVVPEVEQWINGCYIYDTSYVFVCQIVGISQILTATDNNGNYTVFNKVCRNLFNGKIGVLYRVSPFYITEIGIFLCSPMRVQIV